MVLALRPEFTTSGPNATNGAIRATRREAGATGFDCGAGSASGTVGPARWLCHYLVNARGIESVSLRAALKRGTDRLQRKSRRHVNIPPADEAGPQHPDMDAVYDEPRKPWPQSRSPHIFQSLRRPQRGRCGVRRRGASTRRAYVRSRQSDSEASIIGFLVNHPRSTMGDLAKGLNLDPQHVATCLMQLTSAGEIKKASHGYSTQQPARQNVGTPATR